jgi:uncharacterized iron-regulated protein
MPCAASANNKDMSEDINTATVVDVSTIKTLPVIIDALSSKKIVYVGEIHTNFSHHKAQLSIIKELYKRNKKIAIGMEMFQRPFQGILDDYISGRIDEKTMLKKTEYFGRWGFNYNLYKPIVDFAKQEEIPVIALNIAKEITEKVSKGGIESLSGQEKQQIPQDIDYSDEAYKERLKKVFEAHQASKDRKFENFYQAQLLWDEAMAMSIDEFLKKNSDYQIVVIAGTGHIQYGSGIPKRASRRNGYAYCTVLSDADVEPAIADFILFPKYTHPPFSARLKISLKEKDGKVLIDGFQEDSPAENAGLKEGDAIISLDGISIESADDVRIHLLYKKKGERVNVKVLRKILFWSSEIEADIIL